MFIHGELLATSKGATYSRVGQVEAPRCGVDQTNHVSNRPLVDSIQIGQYFQACQHLLRNTKPHQVPSSDWLKHDCTDKCKHVNVDQLWICIATGLVHHCIATACGYEDRTSAGTVCRISGKVHEDFQSFVPTYQDDDNPTSSHCHYSKTTAAELPGAQMMRKLCTVGNAHDRKRKRHTATTTEPVKRIRAAKPVKPRSKPRRLESEHELQILDTTARSLLERATNKASLSVETKNQVIEAIMDCWKLVSRTTFGNESYKFNYHVFVCLYECIDGFRTSNATYLPQIPEMRDALVHKSKLYTKKVKTKTKLTPTQLTAAKLTLTTRNLHMAMAEYERAV